MDLDDLLGGGEVAADPLSGMLDDLGPAGAADDLLGSGVNPPEPKPQDPAAAAASLIDMPKPRLAPIRGPLPLRLHQISLPPFKDAPSYVRPYMTNACFYANQVSLISRSDSRTRRGLVVNDSNIYIMNDEAHVERTVPLPHVEAFVTQNNIVVKSLGMSKENQTQVLLVLREGPDLFFALSEDKRKDPATGGCTGDKIPSLDSVLVGLLQAYELDLPVCVLNERESIRDLVTWSVSDMRMRCDCFQVLAYRTSLLAHLKQIVKSDAQLIVTRNQLEASGASQSSAALLEEINHLSAKNDSTADALRLAGETLQRSNAKKSELRDALRAEEQRRDALVRERVDAQGARNIALETREYALARAVHGSDMRRLRTAAAFLRARAARRGPGEDSASASEVRGLRAEAEVRRAAATEALAEAKRRLAAAKRAAAEAEAAAATWRALPEGAALPDNWDPAPAQTFQPVHIDDEADAAGGDEKGGEEVEGGNSAAQGPPVVLDDDDDDDVELVVPSQDQKAGGGSNVPVFDDDDL